MEKKVLPNQQVKVLTEALQKATEANQAQAKELAFLRPLVGKQTMTASPKMPELSWSIMVNPPKQSVILKPDGSIWIDPELNEYDLRAVLLGAVQMIHSLMYTPSPPPAPSTPTTDAAPSVDAKWLMHTADYWRHKGVEGGATKWREGLELIHCRAVAMLEGKTSWIRPMDSVEATPKSVGDAGNLTEYAFQKWWDENVRDNEKNSFVYRIAFNAWMEAKKSL